MEKEKVKIEFGIVNIKTLKFSIDNFPDDSKVDNDKANFNIIPASFFNIEEKIVGFDTLVEIVLDNKKEEKICELVTRVSYKVSNLNEFVSQSEDDLINLPDQFLHTLLSISLSTTRGILFSKTEGTRLEGFILPVLNPNAFKSMKK